MTSIAFCVALFALPALQDAPPAASDAAPETPPVIRGLRAREVGTFDGFTLFTPLASGSTFLIDMQGEVVHVWDTALPPTAMAYLLDSGHLLRAIRINENPRFFGGGLGGRIVELDWDGAIVWDYTRSDETHVLHHDLEVLPSGNILAIQWEYVSHDDAIALGRDPKATNSKGWWPDALIELERVGTHDAKVVWEWHAKDHLVQDFARRAPGFASPAEHPELIDINADHRNEAPLTTKEREEKEKLDKEMGALGYAGGDADASKRGAPDEHEADWMHTNGIDYNAELDMIVVSSPHLCEIFVLDHSTTSDEARGHVGGKRGHGGDLLYRWGNPRNYGAGDAQSQRLFYQHDPQWIANGLPGAGNVLVYNNGTKRPDGKFSEIDELALPFQAEHAFSRNDGWAFGPSEPAWKYVAPERESFFSPFISGCQRLPNGNTLICCGASGRFFEVTAEGRTVWDFLNPHGGEIPTSFGKAAPEQPKVDARAVFQATRIAPDHPALKGRTLTPRPTAK